MHEKKFISFDKQEIFYRYWNSSQKPDFVMLITHGMMSHSLRYEEFAAFLNKHNIAVYAPDLRGHGNTALSMADLGQIPFKNGWQYYIEDITSLAKIITKEYPDTPLILWGHSFGSFLVQDAVMQNPKLFQKLILSGSTYQGGKSKIELVLGLIISWLLCKFGFARSRAYLLHFLTFNNFNQKFKPIQTKLDWVSNNAEKIKEYANDKKSCFICSNSFFYNMLIGIKKITITKHLKKIPAALPILLISGKEDALSKEAKLVDVLANKLKATGHSNITTRIFPGSRHELINDINYTAIYQEILSWIASS